MPFKFLPGLCPNCGRIFEYKASSDDYDRYECGCGVKLLVPKNNASSAGRKQKTVKNRRKLRVNGRKTRVSHIVWHEKTGHWPVWPEVIHHIDGDKTNDVFENLQLMDAAEHASLHHVGKKHTQESKAKVSTSWTPEKKAAKRIAMTGKNNPMYGKTGRDSPSWKGDAVSAHGEYQRLWRARKKQMAQRGAVSVMPSVIAVDGPRSSESPLQCPPDCDSKKFCDPSSCALESVREANAIVEALRRASE